MSHNEAESPDHRVARELGVDFLTFKTVDMPAALERPSTAAPRPTNKVPALRYEETGSSGNPAASSASGPGSGSRWTRSAGVACEYDYKALHSFGGGSAGGSLLGAWKSQEARSFRRHFGRGHNDYEFCRSCTYKDMQADECNVAMEDLR